METKVIAKQIVRPVTYKLLMLYKLVAGTIELTIALAFALFDRQFVGMYERFELSHLREDPSIYVRTVEKAVPFLLSHHLYVVLFLSTFGIGKIIGVIGLWYEKVWAIYLMIIIGALLVPFEIVDFVSNPSIFKIFYILVNIAIIIYLSHFNPHIQYILKRSRTEEI